MDGYLPYGDVHYLTILRLAVGWESARCWGRLILAFDIVQDV